MFTFNGEVVQYTGVLDSAPSIWIAVTSTSTLTATAKPLCNFLALMWSSHAINLAHFQNTVTGI